MENSKWHKNRKRPRVVSFRMNENEYENLMDKVIDSGMNRQEFMIHLTNGMRIGTKEEADAIRDLCNTVADMNRQLKGMANNLNQLAKVANAAGELPAVAAISGVQEQVKDMREGIEKLWEKLKRAAVLLFHRTPESIITGAYTKIAKFGESDIDYMDEVHGSLIFQADRVIDLVYLKYLKMHISYDKDTRVETYPYAREALREAYFNALCHNDWSSGVPIQIRIDDCKLFISNCCVFPDNWTADTLMNDHESIPYNPDIANSFFRAGYIEAWGKGIRKICDACKSLGTEIPEYILRGRDVMVKFSALDYTGERNVANNKSAINGDKSAINGDKSAINGDKIIKNDANALNDSAYNIIVLYITNNGAITNGEAQELLGLKASRSRDILKAMTQLGLIVKEGDKKSTKYILPE